SSLLQRGDMPARAQRRINQVQSRIHISWKPFLQEVHHDSSGRRRLDIHFSNRCRRIHYHHILTTAASLDRDLLCHKLRTLVVPNHVRKGNRRFLIGDPSVGSKSHCRDARRVHHAPHSTLSRCLQQRARAFHIRPVHLLRILHPEPI